MPSRYANLDPRHAPHGLGDVFRWSVLDRLIGRRRVASPGPPAPRVPIDVSAIHDRGGVPRVTWIGHSSFLATQAGVSFLVDPVFSRRIARFIPRHGEPGLLPSDLPPLHALLVTHNHYDHLDEPSVRLLPKTLPVFTAAGPLSVTFVPARHWSRRSIGDTNRTAWGGFVVTGGGTTLYHAGDTGWFDGFRLIAARFPEIDLALLPIGAYAPAWFMEPHHMNPEQAIDALEVLNAKAMVPMHWGAFQLTDEPLVVPVERLIGAWEARRPAARLHVMSVGETLAVG